MNVIGFHEYKELKYYRNFLCSSFDHPPRLHSSSHTRAYHTGDFPLNTCVVISNECYKFCDNKGAKTPHAFSIQGNSFSNKSQRAAIVTHTWRDSVVRVDVEASGLLIGYSCQGLLLGELLVD